MERTKPWEAWDDQVILEQESSYYNQGDNGFVDEVHRPLIQVQDCMLREMMVTPLKQEDVSV